MRALAHELGVPSAEKPASPCLASRLPTAPRSTPRRSRRSTAPSSAQGARLPRPARPALRGRRPGRAAPTNELAGAHARRRDGSWPPCRGRLRERRDLRGAVPLRLAQRLVRETPRGYGHPPPHPPPTPPPPPPLIDCSLELKGERPHDARDTGEPTGDGNCARTSHTDRSRRRAGSSASLCSPPSRALSRHRQLLGDVPRRRKTRRRPRAGGQRDRINERG